MSSRHTTTASPSPRLLSAKRASEQLGIPYRSLLDVAHRGELPIVRVSTALYFERADIDRWVEQRKERT